MSIIEINQTVYVPLKVKKINTDFVSNEQGGDQITLYVLLCINTDEELSYIDDILYEGEIKLDSSFYD